MKWSPTPERPHADGATAPSAGRRHADQRPRAEGLSCGYIFLRGEYTTAAKNLNRAIEEAKAAGLLGKNILGRASTSSCSCTPAPGVTSAVKKPH
jgi:hypothetical protein